MRKKYDFNLIISYFNLQSDFAKYQKVHSCISFNRAARAFLVKNKVKYKKDCFVRGAKEDPDSYFMRIAKTPWLDLED